MNTPHVLDPGDAHPAATVAAGEHAGVHEPIEWARRLPRGVAVLAAALLGFGVVLWVAANWADWGRAGHFAILQALLAVTVVGAYARPVARVPLALLALVSLGGLLAYFGQTYQTGADPWQLFAMWALLGLPLALGTRSDVLWAPWALVAVTGVSLWIHAHTGHRWHIGSADAPTYLAGWVAVLALTLGLGPGLRPFTGAGAWAFRLAITLSAVMVTSTALAGLFEYDGSLFYVFGLLILVGAALVFAGQRWFDIYGLSAVGLALNVLLTFGLGRLLFHGSGFGGWLASLLLLGLAAAGLLAGTVSLILRVARSRTAAGDPV